MNSKSTHYASAVLASVGQYYPENRIPVRAQYLLERLFEDGKICDLRVWRKWLRWWLGVTPLIDVWQTFSTASMHAPLR